MNNNNFLPTDYEAPAAGGGNYYKLKQGQNTFRIVTPAIVGFLGWTNDNKPERRRRKDDFGNVDLREGDKIKHFWAFGVWNFEAAEVQVMEVTQATIREALTATFNNPAWGSPFGYNITITKNGEKLDTTYHIQATPHSELSVDIQNEILAKPLNLEALFDGGDPFEASEMADDPLAGISYDPDNT